MPPRKRWKVTPPLRDSAPNDAQSYGSQAAAYEAVAEARKAVAAGALVATIAAVWHWEDGDWRLYERLDLTEHVPTTREQ